ncbi:unnamed protein product [Darwinula stevensoni]|uniref:Uncharacterized protein n=1 Tax=Darwinula stevensoni TaxID=69355 RepID=A0A7R9A8J3_9CRUS|nr:unnamed protein product [Darwinula stevensoni]CAG0896531.1 unnamed protein product [Darwinula stevensoni]
MSLRQNMRKLHLPWLVVHPLVTIALMAVMGVSNTETFSDFAIYEFLHITAASYNVGVIEMFIVLWFLIYLWVVVVANYQKLGATNTQDDTHPLNNRHVNGPSQGFSQEAEIPRADTSWAAAPPRGEPAQPPAHNKIPDSLTV